MPIKKFVNDEILDATEVNQFFMDQAFVVFDTIAQRDAAFGDVDEPELQEGRFAYIKDDGTGNPATYIYTQTSPGVFAWTKQVAQVEDGAVTTAKLLQTSGLEAVTTATIRDAAVTSAKLGSGLTLSGTTTLSGTASIGQLLEKATRNSTAITSTATDTNVNFLDGAVYWFTGAHAANMRINFRGNAGTRLTDLLTTDSNSATIVVMIQNPNSRQFGTSGIVVDGDKTSPPTVTTYWFGGAIPAGGSGIDIYTFTFVRTGTNAVAVFASQARYAQV
jgi:hypothetical protein